MPVALAGSVPLPEPGGLSAVLASDDPARFFEEFANFEAYFYPIPLDKWPPLFRLYHLVSMLDIAVDTEDLAGFFDDEEDHTGAYAHETEAFLREIGAPRAAALLAAAIRLFPGGQVAKNHRVRQRATEKLRDKEPEPFEGVAGKHEGAVKTAYAPLQKYMRAHERELQAAVDAAVRTQAKKKPKWEPLEVALSAETPAERIAGGAPREHAALLAVWERIHARLVARGFESLTNGERLFHTLWFVMDAEITNGGIHQFLWNSSGDFAEDAKHHLDDIGARAVAAPLKKASAVFPDGVIPSDQGARQQVLEEQEKLQGDRFEAEWNALDREYHKAAAGELYTRLLQWTKKNRAQFPDP